MVNFLVSSACPTASQQAATKDIGVCHFAVRLAAAPRHRSRLHLTRGGFLAIYRHHNSPFFAPEKNRKKIHYLFVADGRSAGAVELVKKHYETRGRVKMKCRKAKAIVIVGYPIEQLHTVTLLHPCYLQPVFPWGGLSHRYSKWILWNRPHEVLWHPTYVFLTVKASCTVFTRCITYYFNTQINQART